MGCKHIAQGGFSVKHFLCTATLLTTHRNLFTALGKWNESVPRHTDSISRKSTLTPLEPRTALRGAFTHTFHELNEGFGARGRDGQGELVDGDTVGDGEPVNPFVGRLSG